MEDEINPMMNGKTYIEEFLKMEELEEITETSEITNFFDGCNVFVTGGTGFLGKVLVEKLLRSCPNMGKLYMLIRPKKGKDPDERFKQVFENVLFDTLKKENPNYADHVVVLEGDTSQENLGLSEENRAMLIENTNVVFNAAASIRFDEQFRKAIKVNIKSIKMMLLLAKQMKNLKSFVHVSTAFSHTTRQNIDEVFYEPRIEVDRLIDLEQHLDDEALEILRPKLLKGWANMYSFSKAMGEEALRTYGRDLPVCLLRPSICVSTMEPLKGWVDCLYGATGICVAGYLCVLRILPVHGEKNADIIPMDYVCNTMICAAWGTYNNWNKNFELMPIKPESDPIVFNTVTSSQNPITWYDFMDKNQIYGAEVPPRFTVWYHVMMFARNNIQYEICKVLLHLIPGAIMDGLAKLTGNKPMLLDAYKKIHAFGSVMSWVSSKKWIFKNDNVMKLWENMNPCDRKKFNCNVETIDWDEYCKYQMRGIRVYTLKDPMTTVEYGRSRYKMLTVAHYSLLTVLFIFFAWCITLLARLFLNFF